MTDKYQDLREALSNVEYSDSSYWLDRYRGESGPETVRDLLAERDAIVEALEYALDTLEQAEINMFHNAIEFGRAALAAYRKGAKP